MRHATLLLSLLLVACDGGGGGDFESLVIDARLARQAGDLDQSVEYYEEALSLEPSSAIVRIELAAVYLARADVDLIDLDRFALHLAEGTAAPSPAPSATGGCIYSQIPGAVAFDPRDIAQFDGLVAERGVIQLAIATLRGEGVVAGGTPVMPPALRAIDLCDGIENGALVYDRPGAIASLRSLGLDDRQIASALAVNAVALLIDAYLYLSEDIPQQTTWWRLPNGFLGVCSDDPEALRVQSEEAIMNFGEALTSLDMRAETLALHPGDPSRQLVADAIEAYEAIEGDLGPVCEAF
jgi:hypothetical protein